MSWSQDQTNKLRLLRIRVAPHNSLGSTIVQHVRRQIMQQCKKHLLAKRNSWLQIGECPSVLDSDTLSRHMSKLSATVATGAFSQLGSSDTFCAVISRLVMGQLGLSLDDKNHSIWAEEALGNHSHLAKFVADS